jgi:O-methyltransferase involved in polyketide biosynthesis
MTPNSLNHVTSSEILYLSECRISQGLFKKNDKVKKIVKSIARKFFFHFFVHSFATDIDTLAILAKGLDARYKI